VNIRPDISLAARTESTISRDALDTVRVR